VSLLGRAFGVQPHRTHAVRVQRDLAIPAADGVPLLANRWYPADIDKPPMVLLRSPYGRGVALDRMPHLLAERGYQVLYQSLRGTGGSSGVFDGFIIDPADGDGTLSWLREQPWFGGVLATWGASYLGFAQWELAAAISRSGKSRSSRTRRQSLPSSSCIQAADSRWATPWAGCRSSIACSC
jgi:uncharacterized protein